MSYPGSPLANLLNILAKPQNQLVQIYILTIDNQQLLCIGPPIHPSKYPDSTYHLEGIEIGDPIPVRDAIRLLDGSITNDTTQQ